MNNYPTVRIKFDRKSRSSRTVKGSVEILVTFNRRYICIQTGVRVFKNHWNEKNSVVRGCEYAEVLNSRISTTYKKVCGVIDELWKSGDFSLDTLRSTIKRKSTENSDVFDWMLKHVKTKNHKVKTVKLEISTINVIRSSGIFLKWSDFSKKNIAALDDFFNEKKLCAGTKYEYHCKLRTLLSDAVDREIISENPYSSFKIGRCKSDKIKFLTDEEREAIEGLELCETLSRVRDCFLFSCYTGLSYADLRIFDVSKNVIEKDGTQFIVGNRVKTGVRYLTILTDEAKAIIDRYSGTLPMKSPTYMNSILKKIGALAGISKTISMHVAIHTFATWALHNGIPLQVVSKTLGHSAVSTTEIYAKLLEDDVMDTISKLK